MHRECACLGALLTTAGSALAAYPGANGRIAFYRADGYIYSIKVEGTLSTTTPTTTAYATSLTGIYISNIDSSNHRAVTALRSTTPIDRQPVFSPDATKVAFQRGRHIYTINANGTGLHRLAIGSAPSWQPIPTG